MNNRLNYNYMKRWYYLSLIALLSISCSVDKQDNSSSEISFQQIEVINSDDCLWKYKASQKSEEIAITPPVFEIDGQKMTAVLENIETKSTKIEDSRDITAYIVQGKLKADTSLLLKIMFQITDKSPFVRFKYELASTSKHELTKSKGADNLNYLSFTVPENSKAIELRLSDYSHKNHCYVPRLLDIKESQFSNNDAVMGPVMIVNDEQSSFLIAYEHGSQYPNAFLNYEFSSQRRVSLKAVKGNYLDKQIISADNPFESIWFQIGSVSDNMNELASEYRSFILKYQSPNTESRKPYIYYNTWGRQERIQWGGGSTKDVMTQKEILKEIDRAYEMGVDVFVIDAGWFENLGDWQVNLKLFPDSLTDIKAKLDKYNMKMGLWFNPSIVSKSSSIYKEHDDWLVRKDGNLRGPFNFFNNKIVNVCMVSDYWKDHADRMIELAKATGCEYFKWDGLDFDICNDSNHHHGNENSTPQEREDSYGYLMPIYMTKIAKRIQEEIPNAIFDFDVTEATRAVGLSFLSVGKYFAINNGPYFHNFDLVEKFQTPLDNGCNNVFVNPGPARGWFARTVLEYDKWIPSILFLTHYQPDGDEKSVRVNLASLVLGQNGIWGDILDIPNQNIQTFNTMLTKYKEVKNDITLSTLNHTGKTGDAIEVYEKINAQNGKGVISIFSNEDNRHSYCTTLPCSNVYWASQEVHVERDENGLCKITCDLQEHDAVIVFFGVE